MADDRRSGPAASNASVPGQGMAALLIGLGVGWLTGLSVSPIMSTVMASILGLVGVGVTALTGTDTKLVQRISAWPIALVVLGVAAGAPIGITARTQGWFEDPTRHSVQMVGEAQPNDPRVRAAIGGLYAVTTSDCERLLGAPDSQLLARLQTSTLPWGPRLASVGAEPNFIREVVTILCEPVTELY